jgi:hypothetical protein
MLPSRHPLLVVPIRVEERPNSRIRGLLVAFIHRSFTVGNDCALLGLLGILDGKVIGTLLSCMPLEELTVILLLDVGVRRVVTRSQRRTGRKHLA